MPSQNLPDTIKALWCTRWKGLKWLICLISESSCSTPRSVGLLFPHMPKLYCGSQCRPRRYAAWQPASSLSDCFPHHCEHVKQYILLISGEAALAVNWPCCCGLKWTNFRQCHASKYQLKSQRLVLWDSLGVLVLAGLQSPLRPTQVMFDQCVKIPTVTLGFVVCSKRFWFNCFGEDGSNRQLGRWEKVVLCAS